MSSKDCVRDVVRSFDDFERIVTVADLKWSVKKHPEMLKSKLAVAGVGELFSIYTSPAASCVSVEIDNWKASAATLVFTAIEMTCAPDKLNDGSVKIKTVKQLMDALTKRLKELRKRGHNYDEDDKVKLVICDPSMSSTGHECVEKYGGMGPKYYEFGFNYFNIIDYAMLKTRAFTGVVLLPDYAATA